MWLLTVGICCMVALGRCSDDVQTFCEPSITTASGFKAPTKGICKGDLIFNEDFNNFDFDTWEHENTLAGGGNWEFQWYTNNRTNSYVENGVLNIHPSLTADEFGVEFLTSGTLNLHDGSPATQCTNPKYWGCERVGNPTHIVNPIKSARIRTVQSFAFKYGKVVVRAKMPRGDWLWPAIWMLPKRNAYGNWPASGEIDIIETRGNADLSLNGQQIGVKQILSTLHYGPSGNIKSSTGFQKTNEAGYDVDFHVYSFEWSPTNLTFKVDDEMIGSLPVDSGLWEQSDFARKAPGVDNPWKYNTKAAPFDQEFYLLINLAVGGVGFFPDEAVGGNAKPWENNSPKAATDFWNGRESWLPSWKLDDIGSKDANLQVDYMKVYAL